MYFLLFKEHLVATVCRRGGPFHYFLLFALVGVCRNECNATMIERSDVIGFVCQTNFDVNSSAQGKIFIHFSFLSGAS